MDRFEAPPIRPLRHAGRTVLPLVFLVLSGCAPDPAGPGRPQLDACRRDCASQNNFCRADARQNERWDRGTRSVVESLSRHPERLSRPELNVEQCDKIASWCEQECVSADRQSERRAP